MRRLIDLSIPLHHADTCDPPSMRASIEYRDHAAGAQEFVEQFPGLKASDLPEGQGAALERVAITTHNGTHLDAPWHFHSTMNGGEPAMTIDEVPLEWCMAPGVKLDLRSKRDGYVCTARDIEEALEVAEHTLRPFDIVLVNTSAGAAYGSDDFIHRGCGIGAEATLYLLEQGVKVTGTDGWSWDAPFSATARRYAETRDAGLIWEGHKAGRHRAYCHLEKLTNLDRLPATGFTVICLPVKVFKGSAGWTRAVAVLDG